MLETRRRASSVASTGDDRRKTMVRGLMAGSSSSKLQGLVETV